MEERLVSFIDALRAGGVRVSLAESADAFRAVEDLGVQQREAFRLSLRATLVKDARACPSLKSCSRSSSTRRQPAHDGRHRGHDA